jgi:hypothetical protein
MGILDSCGSGGWLHFRKGTVSTVGRQTATYLTDEEATRRLMSGIVLISFTSVDDIEGAMRLSKAGRRVLCDLLAGEVANLE